MSDNEHTRVSEEARANIPVDCHGEIAQVDRQLIIPRVPPTSDLRALILTRVQPIERALALPKQRAVLAKMRELQHDVRRPKARRPRSDRNVVDF